MMGLVSLSGDEKTSDVSLHYVRIQQEGSHLKTRIRALIQNPMMPDPDVRFPVSRAIRNTPLLFKPSSL